MDLPENTLFLGIEIGGTKLQLATAQSGGKITNRKRFFVDAESGATGIRQQLEEGLQALKTDTVKAIGVGFGGPVDYQRGAIATSHQVKGWNDFNLAQWLCDLTGKPIAIENDANTAALAEALYGSGQGHNRVFYMTIGSGIGGGMIIGGNIYHGKSPGEAEIGHLRLTKKGLTLENSCSGWAVNKRVKEAIKKQPESILARLSARHEGPEAALLQPALEENDATAKKIMEEVTSDLAFALSHVVHLFHPDMIVIGGGLSLLGNHLLAPLQSSLQQFIMQAFLPLPPIKTALLGEDVVPVGAIALAENMYKTTNTHKQQGR